jgi:hypothetical protein
MGFATNFRGVYNFHMFQWAINTGVNNIDNPSNFTNFILFASFSVLFLMISNALFYTVSLLVSKDLFTQLNESLMKASISKFYSVTPSSLIINTVETDLN